VSLKMGVKMTDQLKTVQQEATSIIVEQLKESEKTGEVPVWLQPWDKNGGFSWPCNLDGRYYTGVNTIHLLALQQKAGFPSSTWGTYKAFLDHDGQVQKKEKSGKVFFYRSMTIKERDENGQTKLDENGNPESITIPMLRCYSIFNIGQTDLNPAQSQPPIPSENFKGLADSIKKAGIDIRQSSQNMRKLKKLYRKAQNLKRSTSQDPKKKAQRELAIQEAHLGYLDLAVSFLEKTDTTLEKLRISPLVNIEIVFLIEHYISHANRQIEQIYRRVILGESIAHDEKVFSIFEEHTEWISKGKAGVPQELGLKVCIVEDQHGFIIHHRVMQKQTDIDVAVSIIKEAKALFPNLTGCSFDKGFYSPTNVEQLSAILDRVTLPKKGKLTNKQKEAMKGYVSSLSVSSLTVLQNP